MSKSILMLLVGDGVLGGDFEAPVIGALGGVIAVVQPQIIVLSESCEARAWVASSEIFRGPTQADLRLYSRNGEVKDRSGFLARRWSDAELLRGKSVGDVDRRLLTTAVRDCCTAKERGARVGVLVASIDRRGSSAQRAAERKAIELRLAVIRVACHPEGQTQRG